MTNCAGEISGVLSPRAAERTGEVNHLPNFTKLVGVSDLQQMRRLYVPPLPRALTGGHALKPLVVSLPTERKQRLVDSDSTERLMKLFPCTYKEELVELVKSSSCDSPPASLRVGVVLSGGQAAGGHNVIAGLFDYAMHVNENSQVFGFLDGPKGIFTGKYKQITREILHEYRNMGGFDMLGSGRDKIESEEHLEASLQTCNFLNLHGLVIVGGDDSNTNAAILAEYFAAHGCGTTVVGVPKTIDGDLKNEVVEISFGFDTACKTYAEEIGNVCTDALSSKDLFAFVRLMGRSASHITLECALQTRANLAFIGEEVASKGMTLKNIVDEITDVVLLRKAQGKTYGVFLFPEGLIEFIPEIGALIKELNEHQSPDKLSDCKKIVWDSLPPIIKEQLLLDRDPHGNVQVAKIATEQLMVLMVEDELERRLNISESDLEEWFKPVTLYCGYEGRSGMPSNFDANYCYGLGFVAGGLISSKLSGYMAILSGLEKPVAEWVPGGCPLVLMMTMERRHGKDKPVIKKYLVDLHGDQFKLFASVRDSWKLKDCYRQVGPMQFCSESESTNYMLAPPASIDATAKSFENSSDKKLWRQQRWEWMSDLQKARAKFLPCFNKDLLDPLSACSHPVKLPVQEQQLAKAIRFEYPRLNTATGNEVLYLAQSASREMVDLRIGVVFIGQQSPGCENVVWGLLSRLENCGGSKSQLVGFFGARGLVEGNFVELTQNDIALFKNQGGISMLGKDGGWGNQNYELIAQGENLEKILDVCENTKLDGLVLVGGPHTFTEAGLIAEYFLTQKSKCRIVTVPASVNNNIRHPLIECTIGFHSASHAYASLVGNLLTDCASAKKYWYFVRLLSNDPSTSVLEASMQTNPHVSIISEECAREGKDLLDVVAEIANIVEARNKEGKNWGVVLIPEGLISYLPSTRQLMKEITARGAHAAHALSPWARALLESLPAGFDKQLFGSKSKSTGRFCLTHIKTEEIIAEMVKLELASRFSHLSASFNFVTFFFGLLGRSALPSDFDCSLGLSLGMLAAICVESGLTGVCAIAQKLCKDPSQWQLGALPLTALMTLLGGACDPAFKRSFPVVPSTSVDILSKAYRAVRAQILSGAIKKDVFGNPGPMQMDGKTLQRPRILLAEQGNLINLNEKLNGYLKFIHECTSQGALGLNETLLQTSVIHLEALANILKASQNETAAAMIQAYHENVMHLPTERG